MNKRRATYIQRRLGNLREIDGRLVPVRPEVFLDESYIYTNHTIEKGWLPHGGIVQKPGRGSMMVIFGAFIVWYDEDCGLLKAKFVEDFICNWPVSGGARLSKPDKKNKRDVGRPPKDANEWTTVLDVVRETSTVPDYHDYHGNFTADLFEEIFRRLCDQLTLMGFPGCDIHMDGASYHVRDSERPPNKNSKKDVIRKWLEDRKIPIPESAEHGKLTRASLHDIVKEATKDTKTQSNSYRIAQEHGNHIILKTPPYHCELQPIEMIWGVGKNMVGADAEGDDTELSLHRKLDLVFSHIPEHTFLSAWEKCIVKCQEYVGHCS